MSNKATDRECPPFKIPGQRGVCYVHDSSYCITSEVKKRDPQLTEWWRNENGTLWAFPLNSNATHAGYDGGMKALWDRTYDGTFEAHQRLVDTTELDGSYPSIERHDSFWL